MFNKTYRKMFVCILIVIVSVLMTFLYNPVAESASFPEKKLVIIVGFKPGGGYDALSRQIAKLMKKYLPGHPDIIVRNRPGAGALIAAIETYKAKPDGYTFGIWGIQGLYFMQLAGETKYDLRKVTWLGKISDDPQVLTVSSKSSIRSFEDLKNAKEVVIGITGFASAASMTNALATDIMGIKTHFISGHRGSGGVLVAEIRGDVDAAQYNIARILPYIKKGDVIPIIQYRRKRHPELPDVPTAGELGYPELDDIIRQARAFGGPPEIPKDRLEILKSAMWKSLNDPELAKWSKKTGIPIDIASGEEFKKEILAGVSVYDKYKNIVRKYLK